MDGGASPSISAKRSGEVDVVITPSTSPSISCISTQRPRSATICISGSLDKSERKPSRKAGEGAISRTRIKLFPFRDRHGNVLGLPAAQHFHLHRLAYGIAAKSGEEIVRVLHRLPRYADQ